MILKMTDILKKYCDLLSLTFTINLLNIYLEYVLSLDELTLYCITNEEVVYP